MGVDASGNVGFWKRVFSFIIDIMIINLTIIYPFRGSFTKYFGKLTIAESMTAADGAISSNIYAIIFIISLLALLFTFFEYYLGQSPGQMLLRIKVVSINIGHSGITFWRAMIRNLYILLFFPFYPTVMIIDIVYLAFYKERLLEKITGTRTVHEFENITLKEYKLNKV